MVEQSKRNFRRRRSTFLPTICDVAAVIILCFCCRSMSIGVGDKSDDLAGLKNLHVGFGISTLSSIEHEIQLLPVWRPPLSVSGVGR
jgi:hypothetical protein